MEIFFLRLVNLSLTASWLVLAVLLLRAVLRRAPKWVFCLLWGLVALRLLCPVSLESPFSLVPSAQPLPRDILTTAAPRIQSGVDAVDRLVDPALSGSLTPAPGASVNPAQVWAFLLARVWAAGAAVMLLYGFVSALRLRRRVAAATPLRENIRQCDRVASPFVLGIFRPVIYLPYAVPEGDLAYVIAHEQAHIRRRDHWWKPLGYLLLSVYWFAPLLWLAYGLFCRDMEGACDEKVIRDMDPEGRRAYSMALLRCSVRPRAAAACPLAFGETDVKTRVKGVMGYKKPARWLVLAAVVLCAVAAVCFLTDPRSRQDLVDEELDIFLRGQIAERHRSAQTDGNYVAIDYRVLDVAEADGETTVYMWVLYHEYSMEDWELRVETGAHTPTAVTVRRGVPVGPLEGPYELVEYWTPRDGSYYAPDIREKFPMTLWWDALNSQKYIDKQTEICEQKARAYFGIPVHEQFLTAYLGDAPKVSRVAQLLPYPGAFRYSSIGLQTDAEPYELMVWLTGGPTDGAAAPGPEDLQEAAAIAFSLIGNLGQISFWQEETGDPLAAFARSDPAVDALLASARLAYDGERLTLAADG